MSAIATLCKTLVMLALVTLIGGFIAAVFLYKVKDEGTLYLENAKGSASITRETDTGILHIRSNTLEGGLYAQGFAHAQIRLWQLERLRRTAKGELAELFGADALPLDTFFRQLGTEKMTKLAA